MKIVMAAFLCACFHALTAVGAAAQGTHTSTRNWEEHGGHTCYWWREEESQPWTGEIAGEQQHDVNFFEANCYKTCKHAADHPHEECASCAPDHDDEPSTMGLSASQVESIRNTMSLSVAVKASASFQGTGIESTVEAAISTAVENSAGWGAVASKEKFAPHAGLCEEVTLPVSGRFSVGVSGEVTGTRVTWHYVTDPYHLSGWHCGADESLYTATQSEIRAPHTDVRPTVNFDDTTNRDNAKYKDTCKCGGRTPAMSMNQPRTEVPKMVPTGGIKPLLRDGPNFGMHQDLVRVLPGVDHLRIKTSSPIFGDRQETLLVVADEKSPPSTDGITTADAGDESNETTLSIPVNSILAGLEAVLIGGTKPENPAAQAPLQYVKFEPASDPASRPSVDPSIDILRDPSGEATTTLQSMGNRTDRIGVEGHRLTEFVLQIGQKGDAGGEPSASAAFVTDASVDQVDGDGRSLGQTLFGFFEGEGLDKLAMDKAFVWLADAETGEPVSGTIKSVSDVLQADPSAPSGGLIAPKQQTVPNEIKVNQKFTVTAGIDEATLRRVARILGVPLEIARRMGVTRITVDGRQVAESGWDQGDATYEGTGRAEGLIKINSTFALRRPPEFDATTEKLTKDATERTAQARANLPTTTNEALLHNLNAGVERAKKLAP